MEDIALRADVGVGTLYRRFPNKADLLDAVVEAAQERNVRSPRRSSPTWPPRTGSSSSCAAASRCPAAGGQRFRPRRGGRAGPGLGQTAPLLQEILDRSQRAGSVRSDIEVADIVVLLMAVRSIADVCDTKSSKPSLRFLELVLDGLRPGHQAPVHDPLTIAQLDRILRRR